MHVIYTDGGKRKGLGAFAFVETSEGYMDNLESYHGDLMGEIISWGFGTIDPLINSAEAEIVAAREALLHMHNRGQSQVCLISDSMYVVHGLRDPHRMSINRPIYNHVWRPIVELKVKHLNIITQHVKGHNKQTVNTLCDFMCNEVLAGRSRKEINRKVRLFASHGAYRRAIVKATR